MNVVSLIENSPTEELFLLRILTKYAVHNGLPINIPRDIYDLGQDVGTTSLYHFIRLLIRYTQKHNIYHHTNNIVKSLAALPINSSIIDNIFEDLIDISVNSAPIRRELVFSILVREIDPTISIDPNIQTYLEHIAYH